MITYIGDKNNKRFIYFKKAADELKIRIEQFDYENQEIYLLENKKIKIDPIGMNTFKILQLNKIIEKYINILSNINSSNCFLNCPKGLIEILNKIYTKKLLLKNDIKTTPLLYVDLKDYDELIENLRKNNEKEIFIKPNYGSGSAGIIGFKFNHKLNKVIAYTSCRYKNSTLLNTKTLWRLDNELEIKNIINSIFSYSSLVEKWIVKDCFNNFTYDLRVVFMFGKIYYIIPRLSKGPITNLHLNNNSIFINDLKLNNKTIDEIEKICYDCSKLFKEINVIGFDILLDRSKKPFVIELNGQGDFIYQDMFSKNEIYKSQILKMEGIEW